MVLPTSERSFTCIKTDFNKKEEQCITIKVNEFYEEVSLEIPRPFLAAHKNNEHGDRKQSDGLFDTDNFYDVPYQRSDSPTRFTLMGQSGVLRSNSPTICQISVSVCALVLFVLVGMIVYMEVYMRQSSI